MGHFTDYVLEGRLALKEARNVTEGRLEKGSGDGCNASPTSDLPIRKEMIEGKSLPVLEQ